MMKQFPLPVAVCQQVRSDFRHAAISAGCQDYQLK